MSDQRLFHFLAKEIETTARVVLRAQKTLLAQANDITTLSELAEKVLGHARDEVSGRDAEAQVAWLVNSISNIELLTKSQASSVALIATRLSLVARKAQALSAGFAPTASRGNNVIPFRRLPANGRQAQSLGREVDISCQELRSIQKHAEEQDALSSKTRERLWSARLYLEAVTLPSGGLLAASRPVRSAVP